MPHGRIQCQGTGECTVSTELVKTAKSDHKGLLRAPNSI